MPFREWRSLIQSLIRIAARLAFLLAAFPGFLVGPGACSHPPERIFEELHPPIVWPPPPARARIRYVGELRSSTDLKPSRGLFQGIGEFLVGADEPGRLYGPRSAVCTGEGDRVWIADPGGRCLHLFDLEDRFYLKVNRMGDSVLLSPVDLCLGPENSIYVCDSEDIAIHRLSAAGEFIETLRLSEDLSRPAAVSYMADSEELLVADVSEHNIKVLGLDGGLRRVIGQRGTGKGEFNFPCDVVYDGELIWIADAGNYRIQGLTRDGEPVMAFGRAGDAPGDLALPKSIALDSNGHVYVVDARFENVQIFDRNGRLLLFFGGEGTGPGEFWLPAGIHIDSRDRIWICDSYNGRLQVFDYLKEVEFEADR